MITWMQRHRKYLVITIWISTFAFIGAGFVGWGQYSYGDKAGAVAKVGDIAISQREWQQAYSRLYGQYNKVFQGNFDEKQAESFGLKQQAMRQVVEQALILNLANSYNLEVTKDELSKVIIKQDMFFDNGKFSKKLYINVLKQNNLNVTDYEKDLRNSLLIQKVLSLFQSEPLALEEKVIATASAIADKIEYKVLSSADVTLDTSNAALKAFWQARQQNYMNDPSYTLKIIVQEPVSAEADDAAINEYYTANRTDFTDDDGKILDLELAKDAVVAALNDKATNKQALRSYIAFKKNKLDSSVNVTELTISKEKNPYTPEIFSEVAALNITSPYMKPRKVGNSYVIIKLEKTNPAVAKSFEEAKPAVIAEYKSAQTAQKLQELARKSFENFSGQVSEYIKPDSEAPLAGLDSEERKEFVSKLFAATQKRGIINVSADKVVLFKILDQKIEPAVDAAQAEKVARLKASIFNASLIKMLEKKYPVESYVGGN